MKKNLILFVLLATGCVSIPDNITPVTSFQIERYLGKWYEIARLDHRFERGLTQISAEYSMRPDGGLKVLARTPTIDDNLKKKLITIAAVLGFNTKKLIFSE
jgi:apolipoprotein D and lipocalin family protein